MVNGELLDEEPPAFDLTDKDRENLARKDEDFEPHSWENLKQIIEFLRRWPSDLKRYLAWTAATKASYGTITDFLLKERLHWTSLPSSENEDAQVQPPLFATTSPIPFASPHDYKTLYNDWPYGLSQEITHIVVWSKHQFAVQPDGAGDLTPQSRKLIEDFVQRTFRGRVEGKGEEGERVMWFRNWTGLQSVRGIDHIHVLVRDVPEEIMDEWTTEGRT
ncbi:MAG: hypothetical protein Q9220_006335 [cf. Caloplaca sp. 1 TL-2023]